MKDKGKEQDKSQHFTNEEIQTILTNLQAKGFTDQHPHDERSARKVEFDPEISKAMQNVSIDWNASAARRFSNIGPKSESAD